MKKLNKVAMMFAVAALATAAGAQTRVTAANGGPVIDNWQDSAGQLVWRNGTNELPVGVSICVPGPGLTLNAELKLPTK